ncbi:alpha amylase C-terminal domain-containing protein [bacterium]|nr:alpha amylase C-terminal domain-containing protein [bacterium]
MGAIPYSGGTTFRVWAPNADSVSVMGSFNGYDKDANPLAFETSSSDGLWSADVVDAVPGDDYEYVIRYEDQTLYRTDPRALQVENSVGKGIIVDPECDWSSFSTPPFHKQVIYELHIGTFNDNPGGAPGTWNSATQKLDYLHDLGVNMIEVMPVGEFAGDFSWGYNPAFPFAPESAYGTVDDMRNFVEQAHQRDMGVIIDLVHNHWGPSDLDMWCFDGPSYGNGGIYFYSDWKKSTPWGDTRPDYGRYQVRKYIKDNALYWLEDMHCDGLRWDSTTNIDVGDGWNLMQWCNDKIDQSQSWKISIAEDLQNNEWVTKATGAGGAGFDSQWDAGFVHPIRAAIITTNDSDRDMYSVRDAITHKYNGDHVQRVIYTESHDEVANGKSRVPEEIWPGNADSWASQKRSTLGAAIVMTSPGIPMIFEGQELLEDRYFQDTDPIDWTRATTFNGIHDLYRDLIRLRRDWYSTTKGLQGNNVNVFHVNNSAKVIAYHRYDAGGPGDDVIVVANFSNRSFSSYNIGFPRGGTWKVRFNSDWNHYGPFDNFYAYDTVANSGGKDGFGYNGNIGIGKYTAIILSQD